MSKQMVRRWRMQFSEGCQSVHDDDGSHTDRRTAAVLIEFGWELFDQPPTAMILLSVICTFFLHFKKFLPSGERFDKDEELKTSVTLWFHSHATEYYHRVIQKLILRFDKCLNSAGGYVVK
ncbi:HTH_48 domain-containing protein [Trichonephila clavipes]|nr:HTH_48 domain-containing protein [Trichonephila clavipes]